MEYSSFYYF